ncbi:MAG: RNA polymerase sigma factor [Ignavibacteriaceae bacterium]|jgi:RNA polymerase sigma-70 factor (ECF subfamily)|nr:RNA polymerase sigma factor [Ignavibacteriaceae bacterium]MCU0413743.1 RNA polymerase sigma factor [Ignavibacteriaceae bacterium]
MNAKTDDHELVRDFLSGNEQSFNIIARKYQERIYWHARRMLGNHDDAHEIVQQVLLVMHGKLNTFNFSSALYTWIYKITATRSLNLIKKKKLKRIFTLSSDETADNYGYEYIIDGIEAKERFLTMEKQLNSLPDKQRQVFIMRNYDELSYEEISNITGKSIGALKANYFHAFRKLKEFMEKNDY